MLTESSISPAKAVSAEEKSSGKNTLFPVFLKAESLRFLIVGGGKVGLEKLAALLGNAPQAYVKLVAPDILPEIRNYAIASHRLILIERAFEAQDLEGIDILILATEDHELNKHIHALAKARGILTNVADTPELCDFYLSSIVQKGQLKIAISTNGLSPTFAKRLREWFTEVIPDNVDELLYRLHAIRDQLKGDFAYKVQQLNALTASFAADHVNSKNHLSLHTQANPSSTLSDKQSSRHQLLITGIYRWMILLLAIGLIAIGYELTPLLSTIPWHEWTGRAMDVLGENFIWFLVGGFLAKYIDGTLGLGYGTIGTTYLLSFGIPPAQISKTIHISEIFTSGLSGWMHWHYRNVNKKLFRALVWPGLIGGIAGAILITHLQHAALHAIRPLIALYTFFLGANILLKGIRFRRKQQRKIKRVGFLGMIGGFLDAVAGGGWGTLVTSTLIASGRNPKYVVGSVNLARFYVALAGSATFLVLLGLSQWQVLLGLLIGGAMASPLAARTTRSLPTRQLLVILGLLVMLLSLWIVYKSWWIH
ncbi:MAG: TSUP family transporter [Thermoflavifilum aggregans]|nr:TSUP family transporter [Thermoflavifilum aggregans]